MKRAITRKKSNKSFQKNVQQLIYSLSSISCPSLQLQAVHVIFFEISSFLCPNLQRAITRRNRITFLGKCYQLHAACTCTTTVVCAKDSENGPFNSLHAGYDFFLKFTFSKSSFSNTIRVPHGLDQYQVIGPDLGPNCLRQQKSPKARKR